MTVQVSYTDDQGTAETATSSATASVSNVNNTGTIAISGTATEGQTLTATVTDTDGATGAISYQWTAGGINISGATSATYVLTQSEVGKAMTVQVSYTDDQGTAETPISSATASVSNVNNTGTIAISGTATEGQTLTATVTDTDGATGAISYQWTAGGINISGATSATYVLTQSEVGKAMTVQVSYTDDQGTAETSISSATASIVNVNDAPIITSTAGASATENSAYTYTPQATDQDGDGLTWLISNEPAGMTIDSDTGAISWTPTGGVTTSGEVTLTVTDGTLSNTEIFTVAVTLVTDTDGISDSEENAAPNNGDGNNDGVADSIQPLVASKDASNGKYFTVAVGNASSCTQFATVSTSTEGNLVADPEGYNYEIGLINYTLTGCDDGGSVDIITYFHGLSAAPDAVRKYGFTPASPTTKIWYTLPNTVVDSVVIDNETVYRASYTLTDGALGDDDLIENGIIVDPIGPGMLSASPQDIPTLSEWMQYLLILMLAVVGIRMRGRIKSSRK